MNIYIDESGTFVSTSSNQNAWNCVAAYASPEVDTRKTKQLLDTLKIQSGMRYTDEIKLKHIKEEFYFDFLKKLGELNGLLFVVATNGFHNKTELIKNHQILQVEGLLKNMSKMKYEGGRLGLQLLADQLGALPPQLYIQLHCQVTLLHDFIKRGVLYFVQRQPSTLGSFKWKIDQKNTIKTDFEDAFEKMAPPLLQSKSLNDPMIMLIGEDYSHFEKYNFVAGSEPTYLKDDYGIAIETANATNIGKLIRENLKFIDSKENIGIQIADLLASGIRRCLRKDFENNNLAAKLLGNLTVQNDRQSQSIHLVTLENNEIFLDEPTGTIIKTMSLHSKSMIHKKHKTETL